jgi:excisionase family DNA binding protein
MSPVKDTPGNDSHSRGTAATDAGTLAEPVTPPDFFSYKGAAAFLGLSTREMYRLVEEGELTTHEYKRRVLIEGDTVRAVAAKIRRGGFAKAAA